MSTETGQHRLKSREKKKKKKGGEGGRGGEKRERERERSPEVLNYGISCVVSVR